MKIQGTRWARRAIALAGILAPLAAGAAPRSSTSRPAAASTAPGTPVNRVYAQGLANGCQYSASVRGTLGGSPTARSSSAAPAYRTDLAVHTEITCPGVATAVERTAQIRSPGIERDALLARLAAEGTLERAEGTARCEYIPSFTFEGESVVPESVRAQCDPGPGARGGGPRSLSPAIEGDFTPSDDHSPMSEGAAPGGDDYDRFPLIVPSRTPLREP